MSEEAEAVRVVSLVRERGRQLRNKNKRKALKLETDKEDIIIASIDRQLSA